MILVYSEYESPVKCRQTSSKKTTPKVMMVDVSDDTADLPKIALLNIPYTSFPSRSSPTRPIPNHPSLPFPIAQVLPRSARLLLHSLLPSLNLLPMSTQTLHPAPLPSSSSPSLPPQSYVSLLLLSIHDEELDQSSTSLNMDHTNQLSPVYSPLTDPLQTELDEDDFNIGGEDEDENDEPDPPAMIILGSVDTSKADSPGVVKAHLILPWSPRNKSPYADFLRRLPGVDIGVGVPAEQLTKENISPVTVRVILQKIGSYLRTSANAINLWNDKELHRMGHWKTTEGKHVPLEGRPFYFTYGPGKLLPATTETEKGSAETSSTNQQASTPINPAANPSFVVPTNTKRSASNQGSRSTPLKRTATNEVMSFATQNMSEDISKLTTQVASLTNGNKTLLLIAPL